MRRLFLAIVVMAFAIQAATAQDTKFKCGDLFDDVFTELKKDTYGEAYLIDDVPGVIFYQYGDRMEYYAFENNKLISIEGELDGYDENDNHKTFEYTLLICKQ